MKFSPAPSLSIFAAAVALTAVVFSACTKSEAYLPPVYDCECGAVQFAGSESLPLMSAEWVPQLYGDSLYSRRYFITADAQAEDEQKDHAIHMILDVDDIRQTSWYLPADSLFCEITDNNHNDALDTLRTYRCTNGVITMVTAAPTGGEESVAFEMVVREEVNGQLIGFEQNFSGSFTVTVD
jgi:hypothetical protein